jgi:prepilin-type N-terminal cleavage/methylation domain-containing protein
MHSRRGLTLIELMVVVLIIALIATIAVIAVRNARAKARDVKRVYDISQYAKALTIYAQENSGTFPAQDGYLGRGGTVDVALVKYLPDAPSDPLDTGGTDSSDYYYYYVAQNNCQGGIFPSVHVQHIESSNQDFHKNPCTIAAMSAEHGYASQADYLLIIQ